MAKAQLLGASNDKSKIIERQSYKLFEDLREHPAKFFKCY